MTEFEKVVATLSKTQVIELKLAHRIMLEHVPMDLVTRVDHQRNLVAINNELDSREVIY